MGAIPAQVANVDNPFSIPATSRLALLSVIALNSVTGNCRCSMLFINMRDMGVFSSLHNMIAPRMLSASMQSLILSMNMSLFWVYLRIRIYLSQKM